ncbi:hypothetical protein GCM10023093_17870 [Nemorincola caseinilytica]|uniref:FAD-dependent oxidoreductase n=1 Tax=Nemorincola caseinilytica TaxID=2054315 RepID=A0ABP8NFL2_9BACT
MKATADVIVYGNNVGALVAAIELATTNKVLLVNPIPNWGAHFAGTTINGHLFDIGMNYFEFTGFHQTSGDLMSYDVTRRNDSARFFHLVRQYFESRIDICEVPAPQCFVDGLYAGDIVIANELKVLKLLPAEARDRMRTELQAIVAAGLFALHASRKKLDEALFLATDYRTVSVSNHGQTFHDLFIEPLCRKIFNMSSADMPAIFHRIPWAPLFYPETLLDILNGGEAKLSDTPFHYPAAGHFAACIEALVQEAQQHPNITMIRDKVTGLSYDGSYTMTTGDTELHAQQLVWCADLQSLLLCADGVQRPQFQRTSIALVFLTIDKKYLDRSFSTLFVFDTGSPVYRITDQDHAAGTGNEVHRVVVEANCDQLAAYGIADGAGLVAHTAALLKSMGICTEPGKGEYLSKYFQNAINLPILPNLHLFTKLQAEVRERFPGIELVGNASGYVSTSFNDQVVQAMKLGLKYN